MLIRLLPDQIVDHWDEIRDMLEKTLLPIVALDVNTMNSILEEMIKQTAQVWVVVDKDKEGKASVNAMVVTTVVMEWVSETKSLLLYSLYGYKFTSQMLWADALEKLKTFARANGCRKIIGYTRVKRVMEIVESLGGEAKDVLISLEV